MKNPLVHSFKTPISAIAIPQQFTFPFHYEPHALARIAALEIQELIDARGWFDTTNPDAQDVGKMFGVLVVQDANGALGYLAAFSGKLLESMNHDGFVPPIYDMLDPQGHFMVSSRKLDAMNAQILALKTDRTFLQQCTDLETLRTQNNIKLETLREKVRTRGKLRKQERNLNKLTLDVTAFEVYDKTYNQLRINDWFLLREYAVYLEDLCKSIDTAITAHQLKIEALKQARKELSNTTQIWLFEKYNLLNAHGIRKNVIPIFDKLKGILPPAGTGDCAAPKLLQYAYSNHLKPTALAEFWWGKPAPSQLRIQGNFYPACRTKCEPILSHMLQGLDVEANKLLINPSTGKNLEIVYEDDLIVIINKPPEFLSVRGKYLTDSVQERMRIKYPDATGPLTVHRLDMSTSGLLVVALSIEAHNYIQAQFMRRTIEKRYVALLDGVIAQDTGYIDLPLRVDLDNRPYQLVCHEHGKSARTRFTVLERTDSTTRVHFYPITGRTHQLRVHAAHIDGLHTPIIGDDLYGNRADRLYLHAQYIKFKHPATKEFVEFQVEPDF